MDVTDATKLVLTRIKSIEPEMASKILGYLLLQKNSEEQMIRLSHGPNKFIEDVVQEVKQLLESSKASSLHSDVPLTYAPLSPALHRLVTSAASPSALRLPPAHSWDLRVPNEPVLNSDFAPLGYPVEDYRLRSHHPQYTNFVDQLGELDSMPTGYFPETFMRTNRRLPSFPEFPAKICHYYFKGNCKHGSSCKYLHGHPVMDHLSQPMGSNILDFGVDDSVFVPGSLEKLEHEVIELLKCQNGNPVSIANLPLLYQEMYHKTLQAEGYLTESQRHGRAGYSLTKLLARLRSVRLIDRPHGQHSVILAEDAAKYHLENHSERKDPGPIVSGSRQIYLTFPAESTFTEEDVSNYFSDFGEVEDVRIPCQQKRMFGFVTFTSASTVKIVLGKGNPHFVCGARVLVKPYREKSKVIDRKFMDKNDYAYYPWDLDHDCYPLPRCEAPRFWRSRIMEEQEAFERERKRLEAMQLNRRAIANHFPVDYSVGERNTIEDPSSYPDIDNLMTNMFGNSSSSNRSRFLTTDYYDHDSQGVELPENPFASLIPDGIST
ncbi:hypothetical protein Droror1_Dr00014705 [Drosera rotundifolia]